MLMHNLIQYSDTYSETSGSLWQYYKDEPTLDNNNIIDFPADSKNVSFKVQKKLQDRQETKDVEIMVPLKYLNNFWRTLEIPLNNCRIRIIELTKSENCFLVAGTAANEQPTFTITDTKFYVPVVTLSTQYHVKLLKKLASSFKRTTNWNKYQSKSTEETQNRYLGFLIDPSFQGVNKVFYFII